LLTARLFSRRQQISGNAESAFASQMPIGGFWRLSQQCVN